MYYPQYHKRFDTSHGVMIIHPERIEESKKSTYVHVALQRLRKLPYFINIKGDDPKDMQIYDALNDKDANGWGPIVY